MQPQLNRFAPARRCLSLVCALALPACGSPPPRETAPATPPPNVMPAPIPSTVVAARGSIGFGAGTLGENVRAAAVWTRLDPARADLRADVTSLRGGIAVRSTADVPVMPGDSAQFAFDEADFAPHDTTDGEPIVQLGAVVLYEDRNGNGHLDVSALDDKESPDRLLASSEDVYYAHVIVAANDHGSGLAPGLFLFRRESPWHAPAPCGAPSTAPVLLPLDTPIVLDVVGHGALPPVLCGLVAGDLDCTPGTADEYICNDDGSGYATMLIAERGTLCEQRVACKFQRCDGHPIAQCLR